MSVLVTTIILIPHLPTTVLTELDGLKLSSTLKMKRPKRTRRYMRVGVRTREGRGY